MTATTEARLKYLATDGSPIQKYLRRANIDQTHRPAFSE
jgi:hypothetical protein